MFGEWRQQAADQAAAQQAANDEAYRRFQAGLALQQFEFGMRRAGYDPVSHGTAGNRLLGASPCSLSLD